MSSLVSDRRTAVETMMAGLDADVVTLASSSATGETLQKFGQAWKEIEGDPEQSLVDAYITENPNAVGSKHLLDRANGNDWYHVNHEQYHPAMRKMIEVKGFYDAFLISRRGDILYSVFKESDFATNLETGPFKDSGLAEVFRAALAGEPGEVYFSDMRPYAPSNGAAAAFVASQVVDLGGAPAGVVALQIPVDLLSVIVNSSRGLGETTQIYLVGEDGLARSNSRFDGGYQVLQPMGDAAHVTSALEGVDTYVSGGLGVNDTEVVAYSTPVSLAQANWAIVAEQDVEETMAPVRATARIFGLASLVIAVIMCALGWLFARFMTQPLKEIRSAMVEIAAGDFDVEVKVAERGDEIGDLGKTLKAMRVDLKKAKDLEAARAQAALEQAAVVETLSSGLMRMSAGDFSETIDTAFGDEHDALRTDFNRTVQSLNETVSKVVSAADRIQNGASEISQSSLDLAQRTENQAATLEETAAALEELTKNVQAAADSAQTVEGVVSNARDEAEASGEVVRDTVDAMTEIERGSEQIEKIIAVIEDIAFQTNLLALNAGVEAARAGNAGRGFAVVASEVRALAMRSSEAAMEIRDLISGSTRQVERGVVLVGKAGEALNSISDRVSHISRLVSDIALGASEQSVGLAEINASVLQLDQVTQANAAMVEESSAAGQMLRRDADDLTEMVARFHIAQGDVQRKTEQRPVKDAGARAQPETDGTQDKTPVLGADHPEHKTQEVPEPRGRLVVDAGGAATALWQDF
ncbi:HAMP domain-containing protein [Shimia sp. R10_1]|nr:HAMP domain-containing protein [Shimia sp. R10_1]